jgi:hypothetical protein
MDRLAHGTSEEGADAGGGDADNMGLERREIKVFRVGQEKGGDRGKDASLERTRD